VHTLFSTIFFKHYNYIIRAGAKDDSEEPITPYLKRQKTTVKTTTLSSTI